MSDTAPDPIDIRAIIARIDRDQAETGKFAAEQRKLTAEQSKLTAEQNKFWAEQAKLAAEAMKMQRDRFLSPWLVAVAIGGGLGGMVAGVTAILRLLKLIP